VFERFTERARGVVTSAQNEARALKHNYIGTEHILLGLIDEVDTVAESVLKELGVTRDYVTEQIERIIGAGDASPSGQLPFTPRTKRLIDMSLREALSLGHNYVGTEHILLGLTRETESVATRILTDLGLDSESIRDGVLAKLAGPGRKKPDERATIQTIISSFAKKSRRDAEMFKKGYDAGWEARDRLG
jgi:ATP-dependent Clp protease ATP-binding subunit ClpC